MYCCESCKETFEDGTKIQTRTCKSCQAVFNAHKEHLHCQSLCGSCRKKVLAPKAEKGTGSSAPADEKETKESDSKKQKTSSSSGGSATEEPTQKRQKLDPATEKQKASSSSGGSATEEPTQKRQKLDPGTDEKESKQPASARKPRHITPIYLGLSASSSPSSFGSIVPIDSRLPRELRIMSWNIQDLGGGFKGLRSKEVLKAIAQIIHGVSPDICVVIEVLRNKSIPKKRKSGTGRRRKRKRKTTVPKVDLTASTRSQPPHGIPGLGEIEEIVKHLNAIGGTWAYVTHPKFECTGGASPGSETYAFIYKNEGGIAIDEIEYVNCDVKGEPLAFPTARHRRPMRAIAKLSGRYAPGGSTEAWQLPIVAFHSPAQHDGTGTDPTPMTALENLAKMSLFPPDHKCWKSDEDFPAKRFSEFVLASDLNINFEYSEQGNEKQVEYANRAYEVLENLGITTCLGNETAKFKTTLKQVSHHFEVEDYEEEEDSASGETKGETWVAVDFDESDYVPEEDFDKLLNEYEKGVERGLDEKAMSDRLAPTLEKLTKECAIADEKESKHDDKDAKTNEKDAKAWADDFKQRLLRALPIAMNGRLPTGRAVESDPPDEKDPDACLKDSDEAEEDPDEAEEDPDEAEKDLDAFLADPDEYEKQVLLAAQKENTDAKRVQVLVAGSVAWAEEHAALRLGGGECVPQSTFDFCNNGFDRLALVQNLLGKHVVEQVETWVFPLLAAVLPKSARRLNFFAREAKREYGFGLSPYLDRQALALARAMDGAVFKTLIPVLQGLCENAALHVDVENRKWLALPTSLYLKLANKLSDHLPVVMHLLYR
jgi:hypothetical protein